MARFTLVVALFYALSSDSVVSGVNYPRHNASGALWGNPDVGLPNARSEAIRRWRVTSGGPRAGRIDPSESTQYEEPTRVMGPEKPPRHVPMDFDDLTDGTVDEADLDEDEEEEDGQVKCVVNAQRPYSTSPTITVYGIRDRFNSLLIGYDTHGDVKRANKGSLYGWSSPKTPDERGISKFTFDLDYVSITPQGGIPLAYCALIFVPPVVPKFDMRAVFGKPAMSVERYFASEEHLVKALKRKSKKVTSCCFIAYPLVSRR